jgi:hypothetical protein
MERQNGKIVHSLDEQKEFNLTPEVDLEIAVETALAFQSAAQKIWRNAEAQKESAEDDDRLTLLEVHKNQSRAVRLNMYAAGVLSLCPDVLEKRKG